MTYSDVNECGNNNGGCTHKCVNTAGSHRCECPNGQTGCYHSEFLIVVSVGVSHIYIVHTIIIITLILRLDLFKK